MALVTGGNTEPNPNEDNKTVGQETNMIGLRRESIASDTLKQALITNSLLTEILNVNTQGVKIQQQALVREKQLAFKGANKAALGIQEANIEQQRGSAVKGAGGDSGGWGAGGRGLGVGRLGFRDSLLALGLLGPALLRLSKGVESANGSFTNFNTRYGIIGLNQAFKGNTQFFRNIDGKPQIPITGSGVTRPGLLGGMDDYSQLGPNLFKKARRFTAKTTFDTTKKLGQIFEDLGKGSVQNFFKGVTNRGATLPPFPGAAPGTVKGFSKFMSENPGSVVGRSLTQPGLAAGIRTRFAGQDLLQGIKDLRKIPKNTWTGLNNAIKGFKETAVAISKTGAKNFVNVFKTPSQSLIAAGKNLQAFGPKTWKGWVASTKVLKNLKLGKTLKDVAVLGKNIKAVGSKFPIIGSLLSAGIGAMDANAEEMERLRKENPNLSDEQINSQLAAGTLTKDKNKIVGRSVGSGLGAGGGAVLGGLLGSFLAPGIGTAIGAAFGAWIGENIGKFFGEGIFSAFKGMDWGETFRPLVETWNELTAGIGASLKSIWEAFGMEEGENGFVGGLQNLGKVVGILAKVLLKVLIPTLQVVLKTIQWLVQALLKVVEFTMWILGKVLEGTRRLFNLIGHIPGMGWLKDATEGSMGDFLDSTSQSLDSVPHGIPRMGDHDNNKGDTSGGEIDRSGAHQDPTKTGGGYGGDGIEPTIQKPYLTSGFKPSHRPNHQGIDVGFLGDRGGQPLFLPSKAKVTGNGFDPKGYGNWVTFTTQDDGITHLYGHMQKKSPLQMGKVFAGGTYAGAVGNTGGSDGAHLHWETGTIENQVGYPGGKGLRDPRDFGYGLHDPFKKAVSNMQSSMSSSGSSLEGMSTMSSTSGTTISNNTTTAAENAASQAQSLQQAMSMIPSSTDSGSGSGSGSGDANFTADSTVHLSTKPAWSDNSDVFTYSTN